jgi:hypothetical protein
VTDPCSRYRQNRDPRVEYRRYVCRCREGRVRAARRYCEVGARLREAYEVALAEPAPVCRSEGAVA